jgi:hypothetical protein
MGIVLGFRWVGCLQLGLTDMAGGRMVAGTRPSDRDAADDGASMAVVLFPLS